GARGGYTAPPLLGLRGWRRGGGGGFSPYKKGHDRAAPPPNRWVPSPAMPHPPPRLYVGALGIEHRELVTGGKIDQPSPDVCEQRIREDEDRVSLGAAEIVERGIEVALGDGMHDVDFQPKRCGRCLRLRAVGYGIGIARIDQNPDHAGGRQQALQQLQLFRDQCVGEKAHASNIAPRPIHADDEAEFHRIGTDREHNGYARSRGFGGERGGGRTARGDHRDPTGNQLGRECRQAVELIVRPVVFNGDVPALDETGRTEALTEALDIGRITVSRGRAEKPDRGRRRLLRACPEWPRRGRAAEKRDEIGPPHSISSSARSRNDSGMASLSALAVVRLKTKSHLVGCSTGNSAAFVPRRILSTNSPARRNSAGRFGP